MSYVLILVGESSRNCQPKQFIEAATAFIDECCIHDATALTPVSELYDAHSKWSAEHNQTALPNRLLSGCLYQLGFNRLKLRHEASWIGLRLRVNALPYPAPNQQVSLFVDERCMRDSTSRAYSTDLYTAYCEWSAERAEPTLSWIVFSRRLRQLGFIKQKSCRMFWIGIELRTKP